MNYNTLIFDLDGTLLNSLGDLANSVNYALDKLGYPTRTIDEVCSFVGNGIENLIELSVPKNISEDDFTKCLATFREHYSKNMNVLTKPYDGILDLLELLKSKELKMAIVSNKVQEGVTNLNNQFFSDYINVAIGKSPNMKKKPHPDTVFKAIDDLNAIADKCLYIGDSDVDMQTAKNANIKSVGVTWGFRDESILRENGADYIINIPSQLLDII